MRRSDSSKQKIINNCGREKRWVTNRDATVKAITLFCNYYNDCPICHKIEAKKRAKVIEATLQDSMAVFRTEINDNDWSRLRQSLAKKNINSYRITLDNGNSVIVADGDPLIKNIHFEEISSQSAIDELTQDNYLFPIKRRGYTGDWRLSPSLLSSDVSNDGIVSIKIIEPVFRNSTNEYLTPYYVLRGLAKQANVWTMGDVTADNAQEFMTHVGSTIIEMALAVGYDYDMNASKIVERSFSIDDIKLWKVQTAHTERDFSGQDKDGNGYNENSFYTNDDDLLKIMHGLVPIKDRLSELELYKQRSEIDDSQMNEMVDAYISCPDTFCLFYNEEFVPLVQQYIVSQEEESQKQMNNDIPF